MVINKVASIMVTYHPDSDVVQNAKSIIQSCERLVIIDNGSNADSKAYLKELESEDRIILIYNNENKGLGFGLNAGIRYILNAEDLQQIQWIATFDQDSHVEPDYFTKIMLAYDTYQEKDKLAILAPNWIEQKAKNEDASNLEQSYELQEQKTVITSGSLVKKDVFQKIGLFEESYFIDFLDIEFCLRARSFGYKIVQVPQVTMLHNLGNTERHKVLGSNLQATNHNAIRRYYITRNRLYTYKKYFRTEKEWMKEDMIATAKEFLVILLFEKNRLKKLGSIIKGTFDALRGKTGPMI
ncbi:glycosyltransferase family 2 protein [Bacillus sp. 03113]|uniref:glycosyltransferase family 2 protein n=1 Tax=Bacillus sp. 03113 TaxID=2578211 RepID=UPI0015E8BA2F|nr:glycosyltransferase family 2 protein [Bacillus sp. 03113]